MTDLSSELAWLFEEFEVLSYVVENDRGFKGDGLKDDRERAKAIQHRLGWQPIETAPTDGTLFDAWVIDEDGSGRRAVNAYWKDEPFGHDGAKGFDLERGWAAENETYDGGDHWICDPDDGETVTHWMPLPSPPSKDTPCPTIQPAKTGA
jgi:hypothetical protein